MKFKEILLSEVVILYSTYLLYTLTGVLPWVGFSIFSFTPAIGILLFLTKCVITVMSIYLFLGTVDTHLNNESIKQVWINIYITRIKSLLLKLNNIKNAILKYDGSKT